MEKFVLYYFVKNTVVFEVRFPPVATGIYKLQLYGIDPHSGDQTMSSWICDFCILVKCGMEECLPIPLVPTIGWGVREGILAKHNMKALSNKPGKMCIDESLVTTFKFSVDSGTDIHAELCTVTKTKLELSDCVKVVNDNREVAVKVKPPQEGEYALQIFCKDEGTLMYENVCNYLLQRNQVVEVSRFNSKYQYVISTFFFIWLKMNLTIITGLCK